jgi:hypothetical protein
MSDHPSNDPGPAHIVEVPIQPPDYPSFDEDPPWDDGNDGADEDWKPSRNSWPHPDDFWP